MPHPFAYGLTMLTWFAGRSRTTALLTVVNSHSAMTLTPGKESDSFILSISQEKQNGEKQNGEKQA